MWQQRIAPMLLPRMALCAAGGTQNVWVVFGAMMAMMGMLPMVASLEGSDSAGIGFVVHMVIGAIIGALFGVIFGRMSSGYGAGLGWGLLYGLIWWVLGPLLIMPTLMGMGPQFGNAFATPT